MTIPMGLVVPPFMASFVLFAWLYFVTRPERTIFNRYFPLTLGSTLMMFFEIIANVAGFDTGRLNLLLFPLGLAWLALAIVMWRRMPHKKKR